MAASHVIDMSQADESNEQRETQDPSEDATDVNNLGTEPSDPPLSVPPVPAIPEGPTNGWTQQIEVYVSSVSLKCKDYRNIHEGSTIYYDKRAANFTLFLIFVSFMVSAISLIPFFTGEVFKYVVSLLSVFTTTLTTVNKFLRYQENSTRHRLASQRFLELHRNITEQFLLPFKDRSNGKRYLTYVGRSFDQILKTAPYPPQAVILRKKLIFSPDSDVQATSQFRPEAVVTVTGTQVPPMASNDNNSAPQPSTPEETLHAPFTAPIQSVNPHATNADPSATAQANGYEISAQARYQLRRARADLESFAGDYD